MTCQQEISCFCYLMHENLGLCKYVCRSMLVICSRNRLPGLVPGNCNRQTVPKPLILQITSQCTCVFAIPSVHICVLLTNKVCGSRFKFCCFNNIAPSSSICTVSSTLILLFMWSAVCQGKRYFCQDIAKNSRRRFWHATHDCVAPYVDIILRRGRF